MVMYFSVLRSTEPNRNLHALEKTRQRRFQTLGDLLNIHYRDVSDPALDPRIVSPVQPAPLRRLFLIDLLLLAYATDGATKPDADIDGH